MRMSHEFLLHSHRCSGLVQPRTICVTERVKPDPAKSQFQTCRNQVVGANRVGVIRSTRHWAREEPLSFGVETERLPFPQFENEAPFDWIKMVQHNRIINVQRNSINKAQRNWIMEIRAPKEAGHGHTA